MPRILQIAQLGNPILKSRVMTVEVVNQSFITELCDDMVATMLDSGGVGLAAPQVYQPLKILVFRSKPSIAYPDAPAMCERILINPNILEYDGLIIKGWESCLSIPGIRGLAPRYSSIVISYTDINGKNYKEQFDGFPARVIQHEYDHLQNISYLERLESTNDIITEKEYQRLFI